MPSGWFYNDVSGVVRFDSGASYFADKFAEMLGTGWHGPYKSQALADAHTGVKGAQAINNSNPLTAGGNTVKNLAAQNIPGAQQAEDVGSFLHRLTEEQTWVRVGEVLLGGILLIAGVRALASGSPAVGSGARQSATRPVKKVAKAAITVAAPEARLAGRVAAKKAAPKTTARVAAHRESVAKYGQKKPYKPPAPKEPRVTYRYSVIEHRKATPVKKAVPKKVTK